MFQSVFLNSLVVLLVLARSKSKTYVAIKSKRLLNGPLSLPYNAPLHSPSFYRASHEHSRYQAGCREENLLKCQILCRSSLQGHWAIAIRCKISPYILLKQRFYEYLQHFRPIILERKRTNGNDERKILWVIRESSSCVPSQLRYVLVICRSAYVRMTKRRMVTRLARVSYNSTKAHKRVFDRWRSRFRRKFRETHFFVACTTRRTHTLKVHT